MESYTCGTPAGLGSLGPFSGECSRINPWSMGDLEVGRQMRNPAPILSHPFPESSQVFYLGNPSRSDEDTFLIDTEFRSMFVPGLSLITPRPLRSDVSDAGHWFHQSSSLSLFNETGHLSTPIGREKKSGPFPTSPAVSIPSPFFLNTFLKENSTPGPCPPPSTGFCHFP